MLQMGIVAMLLATLGNGARGLLSPPIGPWRSGQPPMLRGSGMLDRCKEYRRNTTLDHFSWVSS